MDSQPPLDLWLFFEQAAFRADQQALAHPFEQLRCPINLGLEVFGDKWAVLIIRDMMLAGKRHFRVPGLGRRHFQQHPGASPSQAAEVCTTTRAGQHRVKAICLLTERDRTDQPLEPQPYASRSHPDRNMRGARPCGPGAVDVGATGRASERRQFMAQ